MARQGGFSYVVVMFLVAILSFIALRGIQSTMLKERRSKEAELLWCGMAYREAIRRYHEEAPGSQQSYPRELKDLLYVDRPLRPGRPLRKLYRDPITASSNWGEVRNENGDLIGVYSRSEAKPLKQAGFPPELAGFAGAQRYSDWQFVYKAK